MALGTSEQNRSLRFLLSIACAIVIIGALKIASSLLIPVLVAFFLAQLSIPVTRTLIKRRVPAPIAVGLTVVLDVTVIAALVLICVNLVTDFQYQVRDYVVELRQLAIEWGKELEGRGVDGADEMLPGLFDPQAAAIVRWVNQADILGRTASLLSTTFFVTILTIFMLLEARALQDRMGAIVEARGPNFQHLEKVSRDVQKYLVIKTLVSAVTGTLAGFATWSLGLEFPVLWGMVAFVLNFIPAIGSIIAAIPPILIALVQYGFLRAASVLLAYLAINTLLGNVIEPVLLGKRFGISTLVVILSVVFWGWMWGPVGMFLAVPLTMLVKVMLEKTAEFRWLSVAMGKGEGDAAVAATPTPPGVARHSEPATATRLTAPATGPDAPVAPK